MFLSKRLEEIAPFHVMRVMEAAQKLEASGLSVCHMEVGEPDFPTAEPIMRAGQQALDSERTKYTGAAGIPELREAITAYYKQQFSVDIDADRILVTPGASGALQLIMSLLLDPGDEILLTDPGYPCNRHLALMAGAKPVALPVNASEGFQPTTEQVEQAWKPGVTRALLLASPANPTGTVISKERFLSLYECVKELGGVLVIDEIYQGLVYDQEAWSGLELANDIIVINSFSKYFGMTGWRIGWLVAPEPAVPGLVRLAQNSYLAPATPSQYAALAAFSPDAMAIHEARRCEFQARRDYLATALESLGFVLGTHPEGAFYLYVNCEKIAADGNWLVTQLLAQARVACTPGDDFGSHYAGNHLRFAYTRSIEHLREGVERMKIHLPDIAAQWQSQQLSKQAGRPTT